jgi:Domain of unknown function (DUF5666)
MSGPNAVRRRFRLGLGVAVVLILAAVVVAVNKSSASNSNSSLKTIGRAIDVSLAPRKYQFIGQGRLQGGSGNTLLIGNLPVVVNTQTQFAGAIRPGEMVSLAGSILANQSWLVDRLEPVSDSDTYFIFAGPLESPSDTAWKVGGMSVLINSDTAIDPDLKMQDMLLVTFSVQEDGTWLASKIESLQNHPGELPTSIPTPTETVVATSVPVAPALQPVSPYRPEKPKPEDPGKGHGKGGGKGGGKGKDHKK